MHGTDFLDCALIDRFATGDDLDNARQEDADRFCFSFGFETQGTHIVPVVCHANQRGPHKTLAAAEFDEVNRFADVQLQGVGQRIGSWNSLRGGQRNPSSNRQACCGKAIDPCKE